MRTVRSNQAFSCRAALVTSFLCLVGFSVLCLSLSLLLEAPLECVSRLSSLDTRPYYYTGMASCNEKRTSRKRTFAEEGKLSTLFCRFVCSLRSEISFA